MKIYTRTGDNGETSLFDGSRVRKDHLRVAAYGDVDELNSHLGLAAWMAGERGAEWAVLKQRLSHIQAELFTLGSDLATPEDSRKRERIPVATIEHAQRFEEWIDEAFAAVEPLKSFVLPAGDGLAAQLHICRTVSRRAERSIVSLAQTEPVSPQILTYVNRLSDLLFAWARWANTLAGVADVPWISPTRTK